MRNKVINNIVLVLLVLLVLLFLFCEGLVQAAPKSPAEIISESISVLREMSSAEDSGVFGALLKKAKGIAIFPSIIKIGIQSIALVLVISNERGLEGFMEDNL